MSGISGELKWGEVKCLWGLSASSHKSVLDKCSRSFLSSTVHSVPVCMSDTGLIHWACLAMLWLILLLNTPVLSGFQSLPQSIINNTNRLRKTSPSLVAKSQALHATAVRSGLSPCFLHVHYWRSWCIQMNRLSVSLWIVWVRLVGSSVLPLRQIGNKLIAF